MFSGNRDLARASGKHMDATSKNFRARVLGFFPDPYPNLSVPEYPPMPTSLDNLLRLWKAFLEGSRFAKDLVLHLHVPFCTRKCVYCDCASDPLRSRADIGRFCKDVLSEMERMAPLFESVVFRRLYVGGGTPNVLAPRDLSALLRAATSFFSFEQGAVRCVEFSPELTTEERLHAVKEHGVNRISLGVQTLRWDVIARTGRPRAKGDVCQKAFELVRKVGFDEVNIDLIFGLEGEDPDSFEKSLYEVLGWGPETITVQLLHDSARTEVFKDFREREKAQNQFVESVSKWVAECPQLFPRYDVQIRPATCIFVSRGLKRPWAQWLDFYSYRDRVTFSTLGFGPYAQSKMHGLCGYQNQSLISNVGASHVFRRYTEELEAAMDMACALSTDGCFNLAEIAERYNGVSSRLEATVSYLVRQGELTQKGSEFFAEPGPENPLRSTVRMLAFECRPR